jgi:hypothetical protein
VKTRADLVRLLHGSGIDFQTMELGPCWMIVCPALGARIMGAGIGQENALWIPPALSTRGWNEGGNAGGQRTWIAPEAGPSGFFFSADGKTWTVPTDLDPGRYHAAPARAPVACFETELTARTARGASRRISLRRCMKLEEESDLPGTALTIGFRHELRNNGPSMLEKVIGLWSIIQLPCESPGAIFFSTHRKAATLSRHFGEPLLAGDFGKVVWLRVQGGTRYKVGMSPSDFSGTAGFVRRARVEEGGRIPLVITMMRFEVDPARTYVDKVSYVAPSRPANGDAAQAYCDAGTGDLAFCEIESHAPAVPLAPGQSQGQDVRISIARVADEELEHFMTEGLGIEPPPRNILPA